MDQETNPSHPTQFTPRKAKNSKKDAAKRLAIDQFAKGLLEALRDFDFNELHQKLIEFEGVTVSVVTHGHNETNPAQSYPGSYSFFQVVHNPHGRRAGSSCWENAGSRKKSSKPQPMHIKYYQHKDDPSWRCQVFLLASQSHLLNENKFWVSWIFREGPPIAPAVASTELGPPAPFDIALAGIPPSTVEGPYSSSSRSTQGSAVPPHQPHVQQMQATRPLNSAQNAATPVPGVSDTSPLQRSVNRFPLPATPNASAGNRESPDKPLGRDENFNYQSPPSSVAPFTAPVSPIGRNDTFEVYQYGYQSLVDPESPQSSTSATEPNSDVGADNSSPSSFEEWFNSVLSPTERI